MKDNDFIISDSAGRLIYCMIEIDASFDEGKSEALKANGRFLCA